MATRDVFREFLRAIGDFLYPPVCLLCGGRYTGNIPLCISCMADMTTAASGHTSLEKHLDDGSRVLVLLPYDRNCRAIVHAFKYHGLPSLADFAGNLMARTMLPALGGFSRAVLVPVPLHPEKLRARGYNQSSRIAGGFAAVSGQTIREDLIGRAIFTGTQTALSAGERHENVRGAFHFTGEKPLAGEPVILIDDVMTTGATLSECARTLRDGGAGEIVVCVVATPDHGDD